MRPVTDVPCNIETSDVDQLSRQVYRIQDRPGVAFPPPISRADRARHFDKDYNANAHRIWRESGGRYGWPPDQEHSMLDIHDQGSDQ